MKGKLLNYYCMENNCGWEITTHKTLDGIRCPECLGMVNVEPGKIDGNVKPHKPPAGRTKNNAGEISITLNMESSKMQRQLRAIAKHTEALANELAEIDKDVCPECGSVYYVTSTLNFNGEAIASASACDGCGFEKVK